MDAEAGIDIEPRFTTLLGKLNEPRTPSEIPFSRGSQWLNPVIGSIVAPSGASTSEYLTGLLFGLLIPVLLIRHVLGTRGVAEMFGIDDSYAYALAVMWPAGITRPGRSIDDYVSFIDIAPTVLELAGVSPETSGMAAIAGGSLTPLFRTDRSGRIMPERDHVLIGKERTDVGRPNDWGYPTRGIITDEWVYLRNYEPSRWPGGNPETGYTDSDAGATKSFILAAHRKDPADRFWQLCFGLRPAEELYRRSTDPDSVSSLAGDPAAAAVMSSLSARMSAQLSREGDPRQSGGGAVFDDYRQAGAARHNFYDRFLRGEDVKANWIDPSDIDPLPEKREERKSP